MHCELVAGVGVRGVPPGEVSLVMSDVQEVNTKGTRAVEWMDATMKVSRGGDWNVGFQPPES